MENLSKTLARSLCRVWWSFRVPSSMSKLYFDPLPKSTYLRSLKEPSQKLPLLALNKGPPPLHA